MDCETFCSRILSIMGRPIPGKVTYRFRLILFIYFLNLFQLVVGIRPRWDVLNSRFQSIEDLVVILFMTIIACDMAFSPEKFSSMFKVMREKQVTGDEEIVTSTKKKEITTARNFMMITCGFAFVNGVIPYVYGIYYVAKSEPQTRQRFLPMPIECWLPFPADRTVSYVLFVSPQVLCFMICAFVGFCWFSAIICSFLHVEKQIHLLCLSIERLDERIMLNTGSFHLDETEQGRLRTAFRTIILNHQKINRVMEGLNQVLALIVLLLNYVCCAQMCVILYSFFENNDMSSRIKYCLLLIPVFSCFFYFCWYGQQLSNKSEMLQLSVAECFWLNKPKWFKQSLQIMMLRTGRPLQIRPFRLYVLNLNNLMMVCQAAYSYFSLMHKMQTKQQNL